MPRGCPGACSQGGLLLDAACLYTGIGMSGLSIGGRPLWALNVGRAY
jgi:hypothetical protein